MDLQQNTSVKLMLLPQMQQSVKILQMNSEELMEFIKKAAQENPMIEIEYLPENCTSTTIVPGHNNGRGESLGAAAFDGGFDIQAPQFNTLQDYLVSQINLLSVDSSVRKMLIYIAGFIDDNGYLDAKPVYLAQSLKRSVKYTLKLLGIIQGLEPAGVGARSLRECLLLQYKRLGLKDRIVPQIIKSSLDLLGSNQYATIAQRLNVNISEVIAACNKIRRLNPKPGIVYGAISARYIIPDIYVTDTEAGFKIELNSSLIPKLSVEDSYKSLGLKENNPEVGSYISDRLQEAGWIIKCIQQRNETLTRVAKKIVENQKEFFIKGEGHLQPMTLRDIAQNLELHESTVSRSVRGKHLQCKYGVFELKYFFCRGYICESDVPVTLENVKRRIQDIINSEDKEKPFSDAGITELLKKEGINIARRTVAKHREEMNIPSKPHRKNMLLYY